MISSTTTPAGRLLAVGTLLAAALSALPSSGALATPSTSAPTRVAVTVTGLTLPEAAGSPTVLAAQGVPVSVSAVLVDAGGTPRPYSTSTSTTLTVAVGAGAAAITAGATTAVVAAGQSSATFTGLVLSAANAVQLSVRATSPARAARSLVPGSSAAFDVVRDFDDEPVPAGGGLTVSRDGVGVACQATAARPTCADLVLPVDPATGDRAFFSTGVCDASVACAPGRDVLQVLARFTAPRTAPATLVVKCDKSLCGGGAVMSHPLLVNLAATGALVPAPTCARKGQVDAGLTHCVDPVQSKRDGSGDTLLYLLLTRDARMSF